MKNCPAHIAPWVHILLTKSNYPAPKRLAAQFDAAIVSRVCECGCNSFDVEFDSTEHVRPLVAEGSGGMCFEANFRLDDGRQIELLLFCDKRGHLQGVDVQCQGNGEPVPHSPKLEDLPSYVYASDKLLSD